MTFKFTDEVDEIMNDCTPALTLPALIERVRLYKEFIRIMSEEHMQSVSIEDQVMTLHLMRTKAQEMKGKEEAA